MKMVDIQQINRELVCDPAGFARQANAAYDAQIEAVARDLRAHRDEHPILLLSGPSGSGKTTTALKIEKLLESWGCVAHTLSLDNYFLPFSEEGMEQVRRGLIDLESPARVDAELLGAQLSDMVAGKSVPLPRYDFQTAQRVYTGETMTRLPGEIVILEGIHALNHDVIRIPDEYAARVYISVRTRVHGTQGEVLHPSRIRLLRRMVRDRLYRGRSIDETMHLYASVERGETLYIMPHKHRATYEIDTFFPYELNAYRPMVLRDLLALPDEVRQPISDLIALLREAAPMHAADIPTDSMIREFIGQGEFEY